MTNDQDTKQIFLAEPEIIVATPQLPLVMKVLWAAEVSCHETDRSAELGLARVKLDANTAQGASPYDVARSAAAAGWAASENLLQAIGPGDRRERVRELVTQAEKMHEKDGLDRMLLALRAVLAHLYGNWSPIVGKNRILGRVWGGDGIVHHGDGGPPSEVDYVPDSMREAREDRPGRGVRVGLIDTGISAHPWLVGGWSAAYSDLLRPYPVETPYPQTAGHATFLTGLILQQAPAATVEVHRVLNDTGAADSWTVAKKIVEVGQSGVDILNLSLMCYTVDDEPPLVMSTAIDRLDRKTVVVAAAGNHGEINMTEFGLGIDGYMTAWPAGLDDVVAVGACDRNGEIAKFTPHHAPWIDVLAPGVDVVSTYLSGNVDLEKDKKPFNGYASWKGTSFAAAVLSGTIAADTVPSQRTAREAWEKLRPPVEEYDEAEFRAAAEEAAKRKAESKAGSEAKPEDYVPPVVQPRCNMSYA